MKIKGNMKKATIFTPELFPPPTPENFAKYAKFVTGGSTTTTAAATSTTTSATSTGLKSERIFNLMAAFLACGDGKSLIPKIQGVYNFSISAKKGGPVVKTWIIDLKNG